MTDIFTMLKKADQDSEKDLAEKFGRNEGFDNLLADIIQIEKQYRYGSQTGSESQRRSKIKELIDQIKGVDNASS